MLTTIYKNIPHAFKLKAIWVLLLLLLGSILDILGIGVLIPLFKILFDDSFYIKINQYNSSLTKNDIIVIMCLAILLLYLFKNILGLFIEKFKNKFVFNLFEKYSLNILNSYIEKGLIWFNSINSTILFKNIYLIPLYFSTNIVLVILTLLSETIVISVLILGLIYTNTVVFLLLTSIIIPVLFLYFRLSKRKTNNIGKDLDRLAPKVHQAINDIIFGFLDMKIYQKEKTFKNKYIKLMSQFSDLNITKQYLMIFPSKLTDFVIVASIIGIVIYGNYYNIPSSNIMTLLLTFGLVAMRTIPSINKISTAIMSIRSYSYTIDEINLNYKDMHQNPHPSVSQNNDLFFSKSIILSNVKFKYSTNKSILKGIDLEIKKGSTMGIMGESGSGKTTLISVIAQLYRQSSGEVIVDNIPITDQNKIAWQKHIGYVSQNIFIMNDSLKKNISFGDKQIDEHRFKKSIKDAALTDLIEQNSDNYDMLLKENGTNLSGGQRQRVGIARALYSGASVFIFDEATSALDSKTEKEIMDSIKLLSNSGYTVIIVTHRITTLANCDEIIKIESGKIIGKYKYRELIKQ